MYAYGHFWIMESRFERQSCDCCGAHPVLLKDRQFLNRGDLGIAFVTSFARLVTWPLLVIYKIFVSPNWLSWILLMRKGNNNAGITSN
jgi:hypothetical protein